MRKIQTLLLLLMATCTTVFSQKIVLDGYAFEENNRGFLNEVKVTVLDVAGVYIGETMSDMSGHFVFDGVDPGREYVAQYEKKIFQTCRDTFSTVGKKAGDKIFVKKQIERQPGYLLEVTLAEKRINTDLSVDAINGCRIEIFNITKNKEELVIDSAKSPVFSITLQQGNQYTVMVRKKGFFTKRMDANVNINGCYLCMDGFGTVNPGVTSNLTSSKDNTIGTLLSNIELERIDVNRSIVIQNIYYATASAELTLEARKELDKVISLMKNNPALIIELGSHTDSRGSEVANMKLSQDRAQSAVNYITASGWIESARVKAKGYGESRLTNQCEDGTPCSDEEHIKNRRTELKILGFGKDPHEGLSLAEIVHQEEMMKFILSGESDKQFSAPADGKPAVQPKSVDLEKTPTVPQAAPSPNHQDASTLKEPVSPPTTMKQLESGINTPKQAVSANTKQATTQSIKEPLAPPTSTKKLESATNTPIQNEKQAVIESAKQAAPANTKPTPTPSVKQQRAATSAAKKPNIAPQQPQETLPATAQTKTEPLEETVKKTEAPKPAIVESKEKVKVSLLPVDKTFTGYKIEVFTSKEELPLEDANLKTIALNLSSDIQFDKLKSGQMSYMVGTFLTWGETERYLEKAQAKYPKAQIVDYYNGKRIGQ